MLDRENYDHTKHGLRRQAQIREAQERLKQARKFYQENPLVRSQGFRLKPVEQVQTPVKQPKQKPVKTPKDRPPKDPNGPKHHVKIAQQRRQEAEAKFWRALEKLDRAMLNREFLDGAGLNHAYFRQRPDLHREFLRKSDGFKQETYPQKITRILANGPATVNELAAALKISGEYVRYHLRPMRERGEVEAIRRENSPTFDWYLVRKESHETPIN